MEFYHQPVLLNEVVEGLEIQAGWDLVDGTVGGGGHSYYMLKKSSPEGRLMGIDRDMEALAAAEKRLQEYGDRVTFVHDDFKNIKKIFYMKGWTKVHGALIDLGVSSFQIDNRLRGFSYMQDGPLDMRMNTQDVTTARELVNNASREELARIIKEYGEERWAARIADFIAKYREEREIATTQQLVSIIEKAIPRKAREVNSHLAKRTFQALRIATNKELEDLEEAIKDFVDILHPGGRLAIISFHSLEDRIVKNTFKGLASTCVCPPKLPVCICNKKPKVKIVNKKSITASEKDLRENSRAKSARLRIAEKL
ncbi:16S rRNA (cytosine(1402)-N(4))-methyltransferase RsmH [Desulfitibacter alkalitolerans]|uniref:16S rRNA (cytosine(1402)-N(4))-methyltransferase RsmH n=1 Tax=Desulfitibacter alkalitolerans TaxID=264641 RepID=UPI000488CA33|nr:16S rRNA (cytosine(1402)-N(4))-methyltransferase RsmH [Desulfitibacter alkalitolerans]